MIIWFPFLFPATMISVSILSGGIASRGIAIADMTSSVTLSFRLLMFMAMPHVMITAESPISAAGDMNMSDKPLSRFIASSQMRTIVLLRLLATCVAQDHPEAIAIVEIPMKSGNINETMALTGTEKRGRRWNQ